MGYDLFGMNPKSEDGEYFRASIWSWSPIMELVEEADVIPQDILELMYYNDQAQISDELAVKLADKLEQILGEASDDMQHISFKTTPMTGLVVALMGSLQAAGATIEPATTMQSTDTAHIREFINFCRESGGFQVQ